MTGRLTHLVAVTSYLGLFGLLMAWIIWIAPPPRSLIAPVLVVILTPLLAPLRGLLHRRRYTLAWSTLLILAYFAHGVMYASDEGVVGRLGLIEVILSLLYFIAATAYLRLTRE